VAVQILLQCPLAQGKFCRAIMQSGRALESGDEMDTAASSLWKGAFFIDAMGARTLEDMYCLNPDDMFLMQQKQRAANRGPNGEKLISEQQNPGRLLYHTEKNVMPALLDEAAQMGLNANVDILIGSCLDDGSPKDAVIRSNSAKLWCQNQVKMGNKPSYLYLFTRRLPGNSRGANHSAELPYQFGNLKRIDLPYQEVDYALSDVMLSYWTNFIRCGDPNGEDLPIWEAYRQETPMRMRLGELCEMESFL
jgi:para-nitrobenzyl esterase